MKNYVLDSSAVLRYVEDEPGAARVEELLNLARVEDCQLSISAVNWGEVVYVLIRKLPTDIAFAVLTRLRALRLAIVPVSANDAESTAEFKKQYGLPYADAFAGALASNLQAQLITADFDFKSCGSDIRVEFLPTRTRKSVQ